MCRSYFAVQTAPQQSPFPSCLPTMHFLEIRLSLQCTIVTQQSLFLLFLQVIINQYLQKYITKFKI